MNEHSTNNIKEGTNNLRLIGNDSVNKHLDAIKMDDPEIWSAW